MKRKESMFFRALGEIPESYIDELTQWQKEHGSDVPSGHTKPTLRTDELPDQKEEMIMKQTAAYSADKNKEAGISVRKLRPVTIGIFASLAACAVIAVGFGSRFIGLNSPDSKPAVSLEEESETEPLESEDEGAPQTEVVDENPSSAEETTFTESVSEEDRILELYSCYGDDSETSGIPEIPKNSVMLFTSMDELRPYLERAVNSDFPVKGVQHAESCFADGKNVLIIKEQWALDSFDHMLRSLSITADKHIHADIACYRNSNIDPGLDANMLYCYMMVSVPGSVQEISGSTVQETIYSSENASGEENDPLSTELAHYFDDGVYLRHLEHNAADYIFPDFGIEMYAPESMDEENSSWLLGSDAVKMQGEGIPESVKDTAMDIIELNLTNLNENCLVAMNNVQSGALPYISVYSNAGEPDSVRRLVFPELKYIGTADEGIRVTLLYAPELTGSAEMHAPFEEPANEEPALPHTDGHASHLTIVCEPATAEQTSTKDIAAQ